MAKIWRKGHLVDSSHIRRYYSFGSYIVLCITFKIWISFKLKILLLHIYCIKILLHEHKKNAYYSTVYHKRKQCFHKQILEISSAIKKKDLYINTYVILKLSLYHYECKVIEKCLSWAWWHTPVTCRSRQLMSMVRFNQCIIQSSTNHKANSNWSQQKKWFTERIWWGS